MELIIFQIRKDIIMYILTKSDMTDAVSYPEYRTYDFGTGYIALKNDDQCILCRYLNTESDTTDIFDTPHMLYDCTKEPLTKKTIDKIKKPVHIISKIKDFAEADKIMYGLKCDISKLTRKDK